MFPRFGTDVDATMTDVLERLEVLSARVRSMADGASARETAEMRARLLALRARVEARRREGRTDDEQRSA